jgi:tetratricopeptide (TPR) repeat protein
MEGKIMMYRQDAYQLDKEYRSRKVRQAQQDQLTASGQSASPLRHLPPTLTPRSRKLAFAFVLLALIGGLLLALPQTTYAADVKHDAGQGEPFAPAIVAYRLGHYYFYKGNYERAVTEYTKAVEGIPQEIFAGLFGYEVIYWDLGDAQLMNGQYEDALVSYRHFLQLTGDQATDKAVDYVQSLEDAILSDTVANITLITG